MGARENQTDVVVWAEDSRDTYAGDGCRKTGGLSHSALVECGVGMCVNTHLSFQFGHSNLNPSARRQGKEVGLEVSCVIPKAEPEVRMF